MGLAASFRQIYHRLPDNWDEAQLLLTVQDARRCDRAAALLGPVNPGRTGHRIRFSTTKQGGSPSPQAVFRLLRRLDAERIRGELELVGTSEGPTDTPATRADAEPQRTSLRAAWERELTELPPDWSDLYAEVRFTSTDYVERAALLLGPVNPGRDGAATLRFRSARRFGYGAAPDVVARCFERCDDDGIAGDVDILWALSDSHPVATQGPVWYVGGRAV